MKRLFALGAFLALVNCGGSSAEEHQPLECDAGSDAAAADAAPEAATEDAPDCACVCADGPECGGVACADPATSTCCTCPAECLDYPACELVGEQVNGNNWCC